MNIKILYLLLFLSVFLFSCGVSYPKETLQQDAVKLIKKETGIETSVKLYGTTMYLDVLMDELATQNSEELKNVYKTLQKIVSTIVRVPISSDADIKIVVVSAFDGKYNVLLRLFENIDDIKLYSHQLISRTDYEQRQLMEIVGPGAAEKTVENKHEITDEEFVSRLSVSQLGLSAKNNPFLAAIISKLDLQYLLYKDGTVFVLMNSVDNSTVVELLKKNIKDEFEKNIKKYKTFDIKSAILYDKTGKLFAKLKFETAVEKTAGL